MKRTYLLVPGQRVDIRIEGDTAVGKSQLAQKIAKMVQVDGLMATCVEGLGWNEVMVICPTSDEARDIYLETLDEQQRETLRGHLAALGYEL